MPTIKRENDRHLESLLFVVASKCTGIVDRVVIHCPDDIVAGADAHITFINTDTDPISTV